MAYTHIQVFTIEIIKCIIVDETNTVTDIGYIVMSSYMSRNKFAIF